MTERPVADPMSLIGQTKLEPLRPELAFDFISRYGLKDIRASVARFDPVTGEKINKLRKSYNAYPPKLGLPGKNRAVEHGPDSAGLSFEVLAQASEEGWTQDRANKKKLTDKGLLAVESDKECYKSREALSTMLGKALTFVPGKLPSTIEPEWGLALGHEKPRQPKAKQDRPPKTNGVSQAPTPSATGIPPRVATPKPSTPVPARPQRKTAGIKRTYEDEVGENDRDYHGGSDGSASDGEGQHSHKKQKRGLSNNAPPPPPPSSYNPASIHQRH